ncbi:hypothetical protein AURDEDRAFT_174749 [Auricularia subglabra TFB-10046 SS5]|nr:hypothetical protein AURDEDRAFT_174749 [Auricularia subglabra TFB-10046 SS5]
MADNGFCEGDIILADLFQGGDVDGRRVRREAATIAGDSVQLALKVIRIPEDDASRERVRREVEIIKQAHLVHPFIVPFFGAADLGEQLVVISPFMRNGNLLQYLAHDPSADRHLLACTFMHELQKKYRYR